MSLGSSDENRVGLGDQVAGHHGAHAHDAELAEADVAPPPREHHKGHADHRPDDGEGCE
jgi:hypothetical protein